VASHQYDDSNRCEACRCQAVKRASLANINCLATETQSQITKDQIQMKLSKSKSYRPRKKWRIRKALQKIPKHKVVVFLQLASSHALIGTHLMRIKKKESNICRWCDSGRRQTRGHLFGWCRAWRRELLDLKKKVERLKGKRRGRGIRPNIVSLFQDE
jgi:hypothetical protein